MLQVGLCDIIYLMHDTATGFFSYVCCRCAESERRIRETTNAEEEKRISAQAESERRMRETTNAEEEKRISAQAESERRMRETTNAEEEKRISAQAESERRMRETTNAEEEKRKSAQTKSERKMREITNAEEEKRKTAQAQEQAALAQEKAALAQEKAALAQQKSSAEKIELEKKCLQIRKDQNKAETEKCEQLQVKQRTTIELEQKEIRLTEEAKQKTHKAETAKLQTLIRVLETIAKMDPEVALAVAPSLGAVASVHNESPSSGDRRNQMLPYKESHIGGQIE